MTALAADELVVGELGEVRAQGDFGGDEKLLATGGVKDVERTALGVFVFELVLGGKWRARSA